MRESAYDVGSVYALKTAGVGTDLWNAAMQRLSKSLVRAVEHTPTPEYQRRVLERTIEAYRLRNPTELAQHMGIDIPPANWSALFHPVPATTQPALAAPKLKFAAFHLPWQEESRWQDTAAPIAAGAVAATPFAGLIGQRKIVHDPLTNPNIKRYRTLKDLEKVVQPGDILAMSGGGWQTPYGVPQLFQGSEFWHGGVVPHTLNDYHSYGTGKRPSVLQDPDDLRTLRQMYAEAGDKMPKNELNALSPFTEGLKGSYDDVVVLRPKTPYTPEQLKMLQQQIVERSARKYSNPQALRQWLRDVFVPKLERFKNLGGPATVCEGNICSTLPAQAYHEATGRRIIPEVQPQYTTVADFLRSPEFEAVGAHVRPWVRKAALSPGQLKAMQLGGRGLLGAGLGAAAYAGTQDPATLAIPAGMMAAPYLARKAHTALAGRAAAREGALTPERLKAIRDAARRAIPTVDPGLLHFIGQTGAEAKKGSKLFKNLGLKTLPLALAGGAGAYLGARALKNQITGQR